MTPVDYKGPSTEDLKKLSMEELIIRLMRDCRERHTETLAQIEQVKAKVGDVDAKVDGVAQEIERLARSVGQGVAGARNQIGELRIDITRDLGQVKSAVEHSRQALQDLGGAVRSAGFLAHDRVEQLESRVEAIERRPRVISGTGGE